MRFEIDYVMRYSYDHPVEDNANVLRVAPDSSDTQRLDQFELVVRPAAKVSERRDYFGTRVLEFTVAQPHQQLEATARARVTTHDPPEPPEGSWEIAATTAYREAAADYLLSDGEIPSHGVYSDLAAQIRENTPLATVAALIEAVPQRFEYQPGVTYVGSTVDDLLEAGAGVCQDFAHLSLLLLREQGLGARYVSGYLFAAAEGEGAESAEVATHAWIEVLIPRGDGDYVWVGADPTNNKLVGDDHVKIGHGRHYRDLPPIRGVYRGVAASDVSARVVMTRLNGDVLS
jgi:transglutaminase-like putative cysteine protease